MGGRGGFGLKGPPTSFPPVTSTNIVFGPQNFLAFSFNPFLTLVQNFKFVPSASPKLLNLNQDHLSKKRFFWTNVYKIDLMITFLIETPQLPNFNQMNKSIIWFESRDRIFLVTSWTEIMTSNHYFEIPYFKKAWSSCFCWHHQNSNHVY